MHDRKRNFPSLRLSIDGVFEIGRHGLLGWNNRERKPPKQSVIGGGDQRVVVRKGERLQAHNAAPQNRIRWKIHGIFYAEIEQMVNQLTEIAEIKSKRKLARHSTCCSRADVNIEPMKMKVFVTPKAAVLDPQGAAVRDAMQHLGMPEVRNVRIGKYLEIDLDGEKENIEPRLRELCRDLLSNPVIEDYRLEE